MPLGAVVVFVVAVATIMVVRLRGVAEPEHGFNGSAPVARRPVPPAPGRDVLAGVEPQTLRAVGQVEALASPQLDRILRPDEQAGKADLLATLKLALTAYDTGEEAVFVEAYRRQGFGLRQDWDEPHSPRDEIARQAGSLSQATIRDVTVTRRIDRGVLKPLPPVNSSLPHRGESYNKDPRGPHDITDPVAEKADVIEFAFPTKRRVRSNGTRMVDCYFRIWLAKRPADARWLVNRLVVESLPGTDEGEGFGGNWTPF